MTSPVPDHELQFLAVVQVLVAEEPLLLWQLARVNRTLWALLNAKWPALTAGDRAVLWYAEELELFTNHCCLSRHVLLLGATTVYSRLGSIIARYEQFKKDLDLLEQCERQEVGLEDALASALCRNRNNIDLHIWNVFDCLASDNVQGLNEQLCLLYGICERVDATLTGLLERFGLISSVLHERTGLWDVHIAPLSADNCPPTNGSWHLHSHLTEAASNPLHLFKSKKFPSACLNFLKEKLSEDAPLVNIDVQDFWDENLDPILFAESLEDEEGPYLSPVVNWFTSPFGPHTVNLLYACCGTVQESFLVHGLELCLRRVGRAALWYYSPPETKSPFMDPSAQLVHRLLNTGQTGRLSAQDLRTTHCAMPDPLNPQHNGEIWDPEDGPIIVDDLLNELERLSRWRRTARLDAFASHIRRIASEPHPWGSAYYRDIKLYGPRNPNFYDRSISELEDMDVFDEFRSDRSVSPELYDSSNLSDYDYGLFMPGLSRSPSFGESPPSPDPFDQFPDPYDSLSGSL